MVAQMNLPTAKKEAIELNEAEKKSIRNVNAMVASETLVSNQINIRIRWDIVALIFLKFTPTEANHLSDSGLKRTNLE